MPKNASVDRRPNAAIQLRLGPMFEAVENWRRAQPKIPPRSVAIRELLRRIIEIEQTGSAA